MQGLLKHEVPSDVWRQIQTIVAKRDPYAGERLTQFESAGQGARMIKTANEKWSELEVEEQLIIPLLEQLGWKLERTLKRQVEMDVVVGSGRPLRVRADFVGYRDPYTSEALFVLEAKRQIATTAQLQRAVEQAESYAGKLRCPRFAVASPEGLWIYDLEFPGQSREVEMLPENEWQRKPNIHRLAELIGFRTLHNRTS